MHCNKAENEPLTETSENFCDCPTGFVLELANSTTYERPTLSSGLICGFKSP